jgi:hypothetical protein
MFREHRVRHHGGGQHLSKDFDLNVRTDLEVGWQV